ncbi:formin-like protein isoform X2 [Sycon ciliatum]|uniref:formin-like protein isoform X2 n=1 Tax=Sycon ciliatum TaxID=27933 RepID=UPI0031F682BC
MNSPRLLRTSKKAKQAKSGIGGAKAEDIVLIQSPAINQDAAMPDEATVELFFERLLERINVTPEKAAELKNQPVERKWRMIRSRHEVQPRYSTFFYTEQLQRHMDPALRTRKLKKKHLKGLLRLHDILQSLEVDLRTNPGEWIREFIDDPNRGAYLMIQLLTDIQNPPPPVKLKKGYEALDRNPELFDEHICVLCLKAIMANRYGFTAVLNIEDSIRVLTLSLRNPQPKTRALVLKLLITAAITPGGHRKTLSALDHLQRITGERRRFENLVAQLTEEPLDHHFQVAALCFINSLVHTAASMNLRVFLQQELKSVGFDPDLVERSLRGRQDVGVLRELEQWRSNVVDVQGVMDEFLMLRNRSNLLRDEVDLLQGRIDDGEKERQCLLLQNDELVTTGEKYHERARMLRERVEVLSKVYEKDVGKPVEIEGDDEILKPMEPPPAMGDYAKAPPPPPASGGAPPPPPPPLPGLPGGPPAPPPMPGMPGIPGAPPPPPMPGMAGGKQRALIKSNVPLPMLNWVVLREVDNTIFKSIDDEAILATFDFHEFESLFQVKRKEESEKALAKREAAKKKLAEQVTLIETNRARNLVIAKRRIGHPSNKIRQYIQNTDLDGLHADHAELLLKFVPTKDELQKLNANAEKVQNFGEAEEFLHVMSKVERYESRLHVMTFAGYFDELVATVAPQINAVLKASLSIMNSRKLRKLFEIILAFGNYMNSGRRGPVYGFKLESLARLLDTRSTDRKQNLLHFLVSTVEKNFPDITDFYEELNLAGATGVSMQTLAQDVQGLRKGIDITLYEREKQSNNFIIFSFYNRAFRKVTAISDNYKKMDEAFKDVCMLFGESPKNTDPSEFFGLFVNFVRMWKLGVDENTAREKKAVEEERKLQLQQEQLQKKYEKQRQLEQEQEQKAQAESVLASQPLLEPGPPDLPSPKLSKAEQKKAEKQAKKDKKKEEKKQKELEKKMKKMGKSGLSGQLLLTESGQLQVQDQPNDVMLNGKPPALHEPPVEDSPATVAESDGSTAEERISVKSRQPQQPTVISQAVVGIETLAEVDQQGAHLSTANATYQNQDALQPRAGPSLNIDEGGELYMAPPDSCTSFEDADIYMMPAETSQQHSAQGSIASMDCDDFVMPKVEPPPPLDDAMSQTSTRVGYDAPLSPGSLQSGQIVDEYYETAHDLTSHTPGESQYQNEVQQAQADGLIYEMGEDSEEEDVVIKPIPNMAAIAAAPGARVQAHPKKPLITQGSDSTLYEDMPQSLPAQNHATTLAVQEDAGDMYDFIPGDSASGTTSGASSTLSSAMSTMQKNQPSIAPPLAPPALVDQSHYDFIPVNAPPLPGSASPRLPPRPSTATPYLPPRDPAPAERPMEDDGELYEACGGMTAVDYDRMKRGTLDPRAAQTDQPSARSSGNPYDRMNSDGVLQPAQDPPQEEYMDMSAIGQGQSDIYEGFDG